MKKRAFVLLALALGGGMACAQIGSVPMPYLVTGDELLGLNVGTAYVRPVLSADASDIRQGVPVAVSFRYDSERAVGTHWAWPTGWTATVTHTRCRMMCRVIGCTMTRGRGPRAWTSVFRRAITLRSRWNRLWPWASTRISWRVNTLR